MNQYTVIRTFYDRSVGICHKSLRQQFGNFYDHKKNGNRYTIRELHRADYLIIRIVSQFLKLECGGYIIIGGS
jgi:hypothetical protein